jgi:hypothetical protein
MNDTENNKEGAPLQHAAEANREREQEQAVNPQQPAEEGAGSVFGNTPRIVSHSTGMPMENAEAATQDETEACRHPREYGKASGDAINHTKDATSPSGDMVNNTGADASGPGADADAASG